MKRRTLLLLPAGLFLAACTTLPEGVRERRGRFSLQKTGYGAPEQFTGRFTLRTGPGLLRLDIESDHHRAAFAFHLPAVFTYGTLPQHKALVAQMDRRGLNRQPVGKEYGGKEVGIQVGNDHRRTTIIHTFAQDIAHIGSLAQIIQGEINGIVHVPQLVHITEAELYGISMFHCSFL